MVSSGMYFIVEGFQIEKCSVNVFFNLKLWNEDLKCHMLKTTYNLKEISVIPPIRCVFKDELFINPKYCILLILLSVLRKWAVGFSDTYKEMGRRIFRYKEMGHRIFRYKEMGHRIFI